MSFNQSEIPAQRENERQTDCDVAGSDVPLLLLCNPKR